MSRQHGQEGLEEPEQVSAILGRRGQNGGREGCLGQGVGSSGLQGVRTVEEAAALS